MGLGYTFQSKPAAVLIGSKSGTTRTGEELESTYDAGATAAIETGGMSKATFYIDYVMGSSETGNSIQVRIKTSPDNTNWYQLVNESASGGTSTLDEREFTFTGVDATTAPIVLPLDINDLNLQIEVKETGVGSVKGTVFVEVVLGGAR